MPNAIRVGESLAVIYRPCLIFKRNDLEIAKRPDIEYAKSGDPSTHSGHRLAFRHLQCRHACGGNTAILQVRWSRSEPDAGGDDAAQFIGARLSSHSQAGAYDCGFGGV